MPSLLIKNGRVIDPASHMDQIADVWIEDGVVKGIGADIKHAGADVFDASGLIVAPGFIDMHVHLREPGFEYAETIESGSRAAAAGGFTSICPMPNTAPVNDSAHVTTYIIEKARRHAIVNVFPIGAITKGSLGEELAAIGSMKQAGAVAISDDGRPVMNARVMRRAMEFARSFGMPLIDHCEDLHLSAGGDMHEGAESVRLGLRGIPGSSEDVMVARDILLAELTGAKFHVAHISSSRSVHMVAFAKSRGLSVTAEATPHHLAIGDADMEPYDSNYKMKPPLRSAIDIATVVDGIVSGAIDAIATDHAPHAGSDKMQEFEKCPFGILGLETALGISLEKLVHNGKIGISKLIELFTINPARILGIPHGTLAAGTSGDVTIFSLDRSWTYDVNKSASKSRNSPFDGQTFKGGPVATVVAGKSFGTDASRPQRLLADSHKYGKLRTVKTTLEIPDAVFRKAKAKAAEQGVPLREFVTQAVELKLAISLPANDKPWMVAAGGLRHLRKETARIQRLIDEEFEQIESEDLL